MTVPLTCNRFWGLLFCARANKETVFSVRQIQTFLLFLCLSHRALQPACWDSLVSMGWRLTSSPWSGSLQPRTPCLPLRR